MNPSLNIKQKGLNKVKAVFRFQEFIWIMSQFILLCAYFHTIFAIFHLAMSRFCSCALCRVKAVVSNTKNCPAEGGSWELENLGTVVLHVTVARESSILCPWNANFFYLFLLVLSYFYILVISLIQLKKHLLSHVAVLEEPVLQLLPKALDLASIGGCGRWDFRPCRCSTGQTTSLETPRKHLEFRWI